MCVFCLFCYLFVMAKGLKTFCWKGFLDWVGVLSLKLCALYKALCAAVALVSCCSHEQSQVCNLFNGCLSHQRRAGDTHFSGKALLYGSHDSPVSCTLLSGFRQLVVLSWPKLCCFFFLWASWVIYLSCCYASIFCIIKSHFYFSDFLSAGN